MAVRIQAPTGASGHYHVRPDSTNATALLTAGSNRVLVHALRFVNATGPSRTVTVSHYRKAEDDTVPLFGAALTVASNSEVDKTLPGHLLEDEDEIRVTVSAADAVDCFAYITQRDGV